MAFQELANLVLERKLTMMFGLIGDIGGNGRNLPLTHRKRAVTILPCKTVDALFFETLG